MPSISSTEGLDAGASFFLTVLDADVYHSFA